MGAASRRERTNGRASLRLHDELAREHLALPARRARKRHADKVQEEVFVVLDGTLTVDLDEPPERHELERGSVLVVQPETILQLRNAGDAELVLYIHGAPPEQGGADFFDDVP